MNGFFQKINAFCLFFILTTLVPAADRQKITFAFVADPNTNPHIKSLEWIYTEAFSRLNMDFAYIIVPIIRASKMADFGSVDGEMARVLAYEKKHPNLIRIEEPISDWHISAFTYDPNIKITSWHDIQTSQYRVEYYRGTYGVSRRLSPYISTDKLTDSSDPTHSLRKLLRGRIDVFINTDTLTQDLLASEEFINKNIITAASLDNVKLYCYLHKRHTNLAEKLNSIFREMKAEGKFKLYLAQAKQELE